MDGRIFADEVSAVRCNILTYSVGCGSGLVSRISWVGGQGRKTKIVVICVRYFGVSHVEPPPPMVTRVRPTIIG